MNRRLIVLLVLLGATALALPATRIFMPACYLPREITRAAPSELPPSAPAVTRPDHYDPVTVTIEIPAASEFPEAISAGIGCPQKQLGHVLGVAVTPGQGCVVMQLDENGPAAKAGIRLGDRLGSSPKDCPSSLAGSFFPTERPRQVVWTVQRPVMAESAIEASAATEEGPF